MNKVAFIGIGAMGSRMVMGLLERDYEVSVWNRNPAKAKAVCERGATLAESPRHAAENADFIFSMVRDDAASKAIWLDKEKGALRAMKAGALAIESSTLSVNHVVDLHLEFKKAGKALIEAPLAGSRLQAEAKKLIFFTAGVFGDVERARPLLMSLGSASHYCGTAGAAAAVKLMVNALLGGQVAMLAELITFARKAGVDIRNAIEIVSATPVCSLVAALSAKAMLDQQFDPAFPIELVSKDYQLLNLSATTVSAELPVVKAVAEVFEAGNGRGFAQANITGIIQLYADKIPA